MLLLRQDEVGPRDTIGGHQHEGGDAFVFRRSDHRDRSAFTVPDDRDALGIDVLAPGQKSYRGSQVVREITERRRLEAAATLTDAALVEAQHHEPAVGDGARQLSENRNAERELVAVGRP